MANENDPPFSEIYRTLIKEVLRDPEFTANLGRYTVLFVTSFLIIGGVEILYGLPVITLASAPLAAGVLPFLVAAVRLWIRSGKPTIIFFLCPNPKCTRKDRFILLKWSAIPLYRKQKGCTYCGHRLMKTCRRGKHYIVSPTPQKPDQPPRLDGFCPFCDPSIPLAERLYFG